MKTSLALAGIAWFACGLAQGAVPYPVVDTGQTECYDAQAAIAPPEREERFYGQDAQYRRNSPAYVDNKDGTVTDAVTGLMWQKTPGRKMTWDEAAASVAAFDKQALGGYADWRLPTVKELDSILLFVGIEPKPGATSAVGAKPFLDPRFFDLSYGDVLKGEKIGEAPFWSATPYAATTMEGRRTAFGIDFATGRLQGYGVDPSGPPPGKGGYDPNGMGIAARELAKKAFVRYVRGNPGYGTNRFVDNQDGTVSDLATGLMWQKGDSGKAMGWEAALQYAETLSLHGLVRWRLPSAKELQSLVDYTRAPDVADPADHAGAAIDPLFDVSPVLNEAGNPDFPAYWTSTTRTIQTAAGPRSDAALTVAFGRALGYVGKPPGSTTNLRLLDVDGAGSRRADPKEGDPAKLPKGMALQRIENYVRCVRDLR
ncbi:Protein of unknown function [Verrucomicrobium sp. GAS474]|uniref:Lcl C-terminal domain-containing protein n=1 Tax=Verrucomicrobium sp. GAS474 TaxID=1882831 RepID=UPI00087C3C5D|nr:DUF1566 domain-containing protein [Verrucomicrobium sp. GAS474]SDT89905.1 Protein of unknown function [Verrucomicrobium sp. GAS474]